MEQINGLRTDPEIAVDHLHIDESIDFLICAVAILVAVPLKETTRCKFSQDRLDHFPLEIRFVLKKITQIGYAVESAIVRRDDAQTLLADGTEEFVWFADWQFPLRSGIQQRSKANGIQWNGVAIIRNKTNHVGFVGASVTPPYALKK
jgi:hypothetical protein